MYGEMNCFIDRSMRCISRRAVSCLGRIFERRRFIQPRMIASEQVKQEITLLACLHEGIATGYFALKSTLGKSGSQGCRIQMPANFLIKLVDH